MQPIKTKQISIRQNPLHAAIKTKQTSIRKDSLHATKPIKKYINNCLLINLLICNSSLRECYTNFEHDMLKLFKKKIVFKIDFNRNKRKVLVYFFSIKKEYTEKMYYQYDFS